MSGLSLPISIDYIILIVLLVLFTLYALKRGVSSLGSFILSLPISIIVFGLLKKAFFVSDFLKELSSSNSVMLAIFGALVFGIFILLSRTTDLYVRVSGKPLQAILSGISALIMFILIWFQIGLGMDFWKPNELITSLFVLKYQFWWFFASLGLLSLSSRG